MISGLFGPLGCGKTVAYKYAQAFPGAKMTLQACILGRHPPLEGDTARARHFQPVAVGGQRAHVGGRAAVFAVEANELLEVGDDSHSVVRGRTTSYSLRSPANLKRSRGSLPNLPKYQAS
jgi:hypothetical protein